MERINLDMSTVDAVVAMAEGNPGAVSVLTQLISRGGGVGIIDVLHLDAAEIYGPNIWIAYKDLCDEDADRLSAELRSGELQARIKDDTGYRYYRAQQGA